MQHAISDRGAVGGVMPSSGTANISGRESYRRIVRALELGASMEHVGGLFRFQGGPTKGDTDMTAERIKLPRLDRQRLDTLATRLINAGRGKMMEPCVYALDALAAEIEDQSRFEPASYAVIEAFLDCLVDRYGRDAVAAQAVAWPAQEIDTPAGTA